jgi:hypothetical protein
MVTHLAQNQFITNSDAHVPVAAGSAAASLSPPSTAAAVAIQSSDGGVNASALVEAPEVANPAASRPHLAEVAPGPSEATDHINEIFFYVRKLMKQPPRFVLDEAAFMAAIEEEPLFLKDGDHLRRWSA